MKFILLVYNDPALLGAMPQATYDSEMRSCFDHADELQRDGCLLSSAQLEGAATARTVRKRGSMLTTTDGPFAETKELLAGFNIIEADSMDEAVRIAAEFPWIKTGSIEVRPIRDIGTVRTRVGAAAAVAS